MLVLLPSRGVCAHVCACVWVTWSWWCSVNSLSYSWARPLACFVMASTSALDLCTAVDTNTSGLSVSVWERTKNTLQQLVFCSYLGVKEQSLASERYDFRWRVNGVGTPHPHQQPWLDFSTPQPPTSVAGCWLSWLFPHPGEPEVHSKLH